MDLRLKNWETEFPKKKETGKEFLVELNGFYKHADTEEARILGPALKGLRVRAVKVKDNELISLVSGGVYPYKEDDPNDTRAYKIAIADLVAQIRKKTEFDDQAKELAINFLNDMMKNGHDSIIYHRHQIVSIID